MASKTNVFLVTKEDKTADIVSSTLASSNHIALAGIHQDIPELNAHLSQAAPQGVVVDIDPHPYAVLRDLNIFATSHPQTRVIVVSNRFDKELILEAMQAGARHFLRKRSIASELDQVLERLLVDGAMKDVALGEIVSVFSAGGGCGATTVALNVANELRLATSEAVLAIDMDTCYGTVSHYLGIDGKYGIADVLSHKGLIDKELVESSAYSYMEDFHVLLSPASIAGNGVKPIQYEKLTEALEACRQAYKYTVIDSPRVSAGMAGKLAALSKFSLVVFQLTVKDLKFARSLISSLTESGVSHSRIIALANRVKKRGPMVRMEDSKKAVGMDSFRHIRSDWQKAMKALNRGQLLAQAVRRSGLRSDFERLAAKIHNSSRNGDGAIRKKGS